MVWQNKIYTGFIKGWEFCSACLLFIKPFTLALPCVCYNYWLRRLCGLKAKMYDKAWKTSDSLAGLLFGELSREMKDVCLGTKCRG